MRKYDNLQIKGFVMYDRLAMVSKEYRVLRTVNDTQQKVVYTGTLDMCEKFLRIRRRMERARKWKQIKKYAKIRFCRFLDKIGISNEDIMDLLSIVSIFVFLGSLYMVGIVLG